MRISYLLALSVLMAPLPAKAQNTVTIEEYTRDIYDRGGKRAIFPGAQISVLCNQEKPEHIYVLHINKQDAGPQPLNDALRYQLYAKISEPYKLPELEVIDQTRRLFGVNRKLPVPSLNGRTELIRIGQSICAFTAS